MPQRSTKLPEVPVEDYGVRVLVRARPDNPGGNLELVAIIPTPDGKGGLRTRRKRKSAETSDPKLAYKRARELAQSLAVIQKGVAKGRTRTKFLGKRSA